MDDIPSRVYLAVSTLLLTSSLAAIVYVLAATPAVVAPILGERGRKRRAALQEGGLFKLLEPAIRKVSGWIARFDVGERRATLDELLRRSGYALGITPDEFMAIMLMSAVAFGVLCLLFCAATKLPFLLWLPMAFIVGGSLPHMQIQETMRGRFKKVNRGLPPAIDLVSLCMGAGADFPTAMRFVVSETPDLKDPVREEFAHILQQLDVGHTRAYALRMFAHRVPTEAVRDFVGAVVQAEEKGNPLAEVLSIQARMLRMRRSVAAEEAAARAGILLIGPLMVLLAAILLILFGPFFVNGIGF
jgi:tight adherence protein C